MKFQILADSSCDLSSSYINNEDVLFDVVPLSIYVDGTEFIDNNDIDIDTMLSTVNAFKGKTSSACPPPDSFEKKYERADYTFVVTITSKLSGTYNSAKVAKEAYAKGENVFLIDSKATSGTMILIIDELVRLIGEGLDFKDICKRIEKFRDKKQLYFILQNFNNLISNGRMSKSMAVIAKMLVIKPLCKAVDGEINISDKTIGLKMCYKKLQSHIDEDLEKNPADEIIITECKAEAEAEEIKTMLENKFSFKNIRIIPMRGLCSYYALEKGVIICF